MNTTSEAESQFYSLCPTWSYCSNWWLARAIVLSNPVLSVSGGFGTFDLVVESLKSCCLWRWPLCYSSTSLLCHHKVLSHHHPTWGIDHQGTHRPRCYLCDPLGGWSRHFWLTDSLESSQSLRCAALLRLYQWWQVESPSLYRVSSSMKAMKRQISWPVSAASWLQMWSVQIRTGVLGTLSLWTWRTTSRWISSWVWLWCATLHLSSAVTLSGQKLAGYHVWSVKC